VKRVYIVCEGQTEERFIKDILYPYLASDEIYVTPLIVGTGGVSRYSIIKRMVTNQCKTDRTAYVSMMFDYYGFPKDAPDYEKCDLDIQENVRNFERAIGNDIDQNNFIPNLVLHEFEGLLFSDTDSFLYCMDQKYADQLAVIRKKFLTPEHINNGYETAPSKRIKGVCPQYNKIVDGIQIAKRIGIEKMIRECCHFGEWIDRLRGIGKTK